MLLHALNAVLLVALLTASRVPLAAWWLLAAAAFIPVSQLLPFRYPVADRYLYFMLPGLIGGSWLAAIALMQWLRAHGAPPLAARIRPRAAGTAVLLMSAWFGYMAMHRSSGSRCS